MAEQCICACASKTGDSPLSSGEDLDAHSRWRLSWGRVAVIVLVLFLALTLFSYIESLGLYGEISGLYGEISRNPVG